MSLGKQLSSNDRFRLDNLCTCGLFVYTLLGTPAWSYSLFTQAGRLLADSKLLVSTCLLLKCSVFRLKVVRSLSAVAERKRRNKRVRHTTGEIIRHESCRVHTHNTRRTRMFYTYRITAIVALHIRHQLTGITQYLMYNETFLSTKASVYATRWCAKTRSRNRHMRCKSESNETIIIISVPYTAHNGVVSLPAPPSVSSMSYVRLNPVPLYRSLVHHLRYPHPYSFFFTIFLFCLTNHVRFIVIADRPSVSRKHPVFFLPHRACTQVLQIL